MGQILGVKPALSSSLAMRSVPKEVWPGRAGGRGPQRQPSPLLKIRVSAFSLGSPAAESPARAVRRMRAAKRAQKNHQKGLGNANAAPAARAAATALRLIIAAGAGGGSSGARAARGAADGGADGAGAGVCAEGPGGRLVPPLVTPRRRPAPDSLILTNVSLTSISFKTKKRKAQTRQQR